jgi:phospholipid-binding lipoprotein MlaA
MSRLPHLLLLLAALSAGPVVAAPGAQPAAAVPGAAAAEPQAVDARPAYLDEGDYALGPVILDPWEPANRRIYAFNRGFDRIAFLPIARGYQRLTPSVLRLGVSNFFDNLMQPVTALNLLLQGRPVQAATSLGRFTMNATLGLGGFLDPATHANIPRRSADFGQTFSRWGWETSRYVVLPIFGPATARDTFGKVANSQFSPVSELARREGPYVSVLYGIDARARALSAEAMLAGSADEYALVRDAYLQYRRCQVIDCSEELPAYLLPDYEFEIPDFEALRR